MDSTQIMNGDKHDIKKIFSPGQKFLQDCCRTDPESQWQESFQNRGAFGPIDLQIHSALPALTSLWFLVEALWSITEGWLMSINSENIDATDLSNLCSSWKGRTLLLCRLSTCSCFSCPISGGSVVRELKERFTFFNFGNLEIFDGLGMKVD